MANVFFPKRNSFLVFFPVGVAYNSIFTIDSN